MSKDTFYFSHDYNAIQDPKISKMILKMGIESYGIYWGIVEMIYNQNGKIECDYELISFKLNSDAEKIKAVVNEFKLFKVKKGCIISDSITRRLLLRQEKSDKARQSSLARRSISDRSTNDKRSISDRLAIKESKVKYNKKEKAQIAACDAAAFVPPTVEEVRKYFYEAKLLNSNPINFFNEYENKLTANWKQDALNYAKNGK